MRGLDAGRKWTRRIVSGAFRFVGGFLFLAGLVLGCYEGVEWMQTGRWQPIILMDAIGSFLPRAFRDWLAHPMSWFGLRDIALWLIQIPLFASLLFLGFILLLVGA